MRTVSFHPKYYHIVLTEDVNVLSEEGRAPEKVGDGNRD